MKANPVARSAGVTSRTNNLEMLALTIGIFAVLLVVCLVSVIWPEAI